VPYKKIGINFPQRGYATVFKKEGGDHMKVFRAAAFLVHSTQKRPIYMVDNIAALKRLVVETDACKVNLVVLKPMQNAR
jgi:hypothetical protein